jgi:hypothetical protein
VGPQTAGDFSQPQYPPPAYQPTWMGVAPSPSSVKTQPTSQCQFYAADRSRSYVADINGDRSPQNVTATSLFFVQPPPQATTCGGRNTSRCRCYWAQRTSLVRGYIDGKHRVTVATTCEFTPFHNGCRLWDTATTPTVSSELASVQDDHPICPFLVSLPDSSLTRSGWSDGTSEPAFSQLPALLFGPGCRHLCRVSERICAGQPSAANGDTSETRCFWRKSSP